MTRDTPIYNTKVPHWQQHAVTIIGLLFAGGLAWGIITTKVEAADEKITQNRERIEKLEEGVGELRTGQEVIKNTLENEKSIQEKYRQATARTLERILDMVIRSNANVSPRPRP